MKNNVSILLTILFFLGWQIIMAQERTISGTITSAEDGLSLPGVSVVVKGTSIGTITDMDGQYSINVPSDGEILVFSFVGMKTVELSIESNTILDLVMEPDVLGLEEVIVTAAGIRREKKALGYSVEDVDGEKLQQVAEPDALRALQGKVPGVNITSTSGAPGSSTRITIRGSSSLLGNNQPLFVVDGIPFDNSSNSMFSGLGDGSAYGSRAGDIDPNNIESITVLKGAAAAALYGSRAANGVVVITTKSGNAGASAKGMEITYNGSFGIEQIANLPDYQNTYGTGTNFNYQQANGSWGAPFIGTRPYATTDSISHWFDGRAGMEKYWGTNVSYQAYPDNVKNLFETGVVIDNSLTISGGTENSAISMTMSYVNNDGYVPSTNFSRANVSVGGQTQLANGFNVGGAVSYVRSGQKAVQSGVGSLGTNNQSAFARALYLGRNWDIHGQEYQNPVDQGSEFMVGRGQADNPLWSYENAGFISHTNRVTANINLEYDLTNWLTISYKIGMDAYNDRQKDFIRPGSTGAQGQGRVTTYDVSWEEIESNLLITFNKYFGDWNLRAIAGNNVNQRTKDAQALQGSSYVVFDIDDLDNANAVVPLGGIYSQRRIWGLFTDISLGYKGWAYLGLTGRNDWSSTLPIENRSYFYPAVTGSILLTDALKIESNLLNLLKLRAAWSQVGNDTNPYLIRPVYLINDYYGTTPRPTAELPFTPTSGSTSPGASLSNQERDPNLKPERTEEMELGLDIFTFNSKFGINFTYYKRIAKDQIAPVSLPVSTGFNQLLTNFGKVKNEGVELGVHITPAETSSGFRWNIFGIFTHNKNVVLELADGVDEITVLGSNVANQSSYFAGNVSSVLRPGQEYGLLKGSVSMRDQDGNLLIDPSNGQLIRDPNPAIIGNPNPDFIVGITNTFSFKGIRLSAVFDWKEGGDLFSNTVLSILGRGVSKFNEDREMMKIIPGVYGDPNTYEPLRDGEGNKIQNTTMVETNSLFFGETFAINAANEWAVFDATVYRLREVSLGYDLPSFILENTPFGRASISITGRNLWFWAPHFPKYTNYDPEINQYSNSNVQGIEYSTTPSTRRFTLNIRLTF
jgi:TonB-linked SusC/RagA family outer membrane protein